MSCNRVLGHLVRVRVWVGAMSSLVMGGIELASSSQSSSYALPVPSNDNVQCQCQSSNVQRQTSNDLQRSVVSCWVAVAGQGVQKKGKKIAWGLATMQSVKLGGCFTKKNLQRKIYIVPETSECLVNFVPSQKQRQWKDYEFRTAG